MQGKVFQNLGLAVGVLLTAALAVGGFQHAQGNPSSSTIPTPGLTPSDTEPPSVAIIGGSFAVASAANKAPAWPKQLATSTGWYVSALAVDGSGYLAAGTGSGFSDRVQTAISTYPNIDYVVLAGGREDVSTFSTKKIVRAARKDVEALRQSLTAEVIVLGPFSSGEEKDETETSKKSKRPTPSELEQLTSALEALCKRLDVPFIDVTGMVTKVGVASDGVHLNDEGHTVLAGKLESALAEYVQGPAVSK